MGSPNTIKGLSKGRKVGLGNTVYAWRRTEWSLIEESRININPQYKNIFDQVIQINQSVINGKKNKYHLRPIRKTERCLFWRHCHISMISFPPLRFFFSQRSNINPATLENVEHPSFERRLSTLIEQFNERYKWIIKLKSQYCLRLVYFQATPSEIIPASD